MKVAYIVSLRQGLVSFIYREIKEIRNLDITPVLFIIRNGKGVYMPHDDWECYYLSAWLLPIRHLLLLLRGPIKYFKLFYEALCEGTLIHFMIGGYFVITARIKEIQWIHCHYGNHPLWIGYYCKAFVKIPLSCTIHNVELFKNMKESFTIKALQVCDNIISISNYNKEILKEKFRADPSKINVIPMCADTNKYSSDTRKRILIVANFNETKGLDTLLLAIKQIKRDDIVLWIVGGEQWGKYAEPIDVKRMINELGIEDQVTLFGFIHENLLRILYEHCDIFCLPSKTGKQGEKEGIPVSLMEAMSFGKPVISTYHAGIPELVEKILINEDDVNALAEAIGELCDNPSLREKLGKNNRLIIEDRFSIKNISHLKDIFFSK